MSRNAHNYMHVHFSLINVVKCPRVKSKRKPTVGFFVSVGFGVVTAFASLKERVRRTLYKLNCPYFSL